MAVGVEDDVLAGACTAAGGVLHGGSGVVGGAFAGDDAAGGELDSGLGVVGGAFAGDAAGGDLIGDAVATSA